MARKYADAGILYRKLERASLEIRSYEYASLESNDDLSSQLGYVVLFCDAAGVAQVLDYSSRKLRRVASLIMEAEVVAFVEEFDYSYMIS